MQDRIEKDTRYIRNRPGYRGISRFQVRNIVSGDPAAQIASIQQLIWIIVSPCTVRGSVFRGTYGNSSRFSKFIVFFFSSYFFLFLPVPPSGGGLNGGKDQRCSFYLSLSFSSIQDNNGNNFNVGNVNSTRKITRDSKINSGSGLMSCV